MFKKRKEATLAIDLSPDAVRVVDVNFRRGAPQLTAVATGAVEAGDVQSLPERHLAALEKLMSEQRLRSRQCVATMPTNLVATRSVTIDPAKPLSADDQIRQTLHNIMSGESRDVVFDYWPVFAAQPRDKAHEVLVVATQRPVVNRYLQGFSKLKLNCSHIDVAPCALAALISSLLPNQDAMIGTVVLTETQGFFAVVEKKRVLFWRPFDLAGSGKTAQANLSRVGDEISKCVSHMVGTLHLDGMTEIFAFGKGVHEETLNGYLMNRFNLHVQTPSPWDSLPADAVPAELKAGLNDAAATQYATALGLALQAAGGSNG